MCPQRVSYVEKCDIREVLSPNIVIIIFRNLDFRPELLNAFLFFPFFIDDAKVHESFLTDLCFEVLCDLM